MTEKELWAEFCSKKNVDINTPYEAWGFGGVEESDTDKLAELILQGKKFGTASSYDEYVMEDITDEIPKVGDYSVILNSKDEAVCVIKDYDVYIRPFGDVPPFHAYAEGEGNMSLEYWRNVHTSFFKECLDETDMPFNQESKIICEKFSVEYIPGENLPDEELLFVEPSMNFEKEIAAYRQEMLDADSSFDGCFSMKKKSGTFTSRIFPNIFLPQISDKINHLNSALCAFKAFVSCLCAGSLDCLFYSICCEDTEHYRNAAV